MQTDKTKESVIEIKRELMDMLDSRPIMVEELNRAKDLQTLTLPGRLETRGAVSSDIENLVRFGFSDDYYDTLKIRLNVLDVEAISRSALTSRIPKAQMRAGPGCQSAAFCCATAPPCAKPGNRSMR